MKLSKNLTLQECIKSGTAKRLGIDNTPKEKHVFSLKETANNIFQPVREFFNTPIYVSSGYRSEELNKAIGGSSSSQHCKGEALDLDADVFGGVTNDQIFTYIKDHLDFDQLIWEFGNEYTPDWVHVSYKGKHNRNNILKAEKINGKTVYSRFI